MDHRSHNFECFWPTPDPKHQRLLGQTQWKSIERWHIRCLERSLLKTMLATSVYRKIPDAHASIWIQGKTGGRWREIPVVIQLLNCWTVEKEKPVFLLNRNCYDLWLMTYAHVLCIECCRAIWRAGLGLAYAQAIERVDSLEDCAEGRLAVGLGFFAGFG